MTLVCIVKDWDKQNLLRQSPDEGGVWDGVTFTLDSVASCDYLIVLNRVPQAIDVICPPQHIWCIVQEPPVAEYAWLQQGFPNFQRVYTPDDTLIGERYIHSHGALPWWVGKSYNELRRLAPPDKPRRLSWITSSAVGRAGHRQRMAFLKHIQRHINFDLWGKGFQPIEDKWDGLAPYRYALAIENHSGPYYWTEKLMDCLLAWTMPIYYGCTNIDDYLPSEAFVKIDIEKPGEATEIIREAIGGDLWLKNRDAIAYARELILDKYQFFPFIVQQIRDFEATNPAYPAQQVHLPELPYQYPGRVTVRPSLPCRALNKARRLVKKLL